MPLPRVTYSNIAEDFSPVHRFLDQELPRFEGSLGKRVGQMIGRCEDFSGTAYEVFSPISNKLCLGTFIDASNEAVDRAVLTAERRQVAWGKTPWADRAERLERWAQALDRNKYELAMASLYEIGKSRLEAVGEAEEAVDLARFYAEELRRNQGYDHPLTKAFEDEDTRSLLKPVGVFGVIAPFNFPIALSVNMIAAALAAGNTMVFKPSPGCVLTGRLIAQSAMDSGLDDLVQLITGGAEAGRRLTEHPRLRGIAFTGSHAAGMSIARAAIMQPHAKAVVAEMGGKNPAYVTKTANLDIAAEGVARSAFGLQGQKCSACSVAYVDESVRADFLDKLLEYTRKLKVGDPRVKDTFMGAIYGEKSLARFEQAVNSARAEGRVLYGGERRTDGSLADGYFVDPTVVELAKPSRLTREELFLPFLVIRGCADLAAGLSEGNDVNYGLAAGIFSESPDELDYFFDHVDAGVTYANRRSGATTGAWPGIQTFAGWKGSGLSGKGGFGPYFLPQFAKEQSRTIMKTRRAGGG